MYSICFTGHRPDKLKGGYNHCEKYLYPVLKEFLEAEKENISLSISGMALGVDQIAAKVCLDLEIPVLAAIPCAGQFIMWPDKSRREYMELIGRIETSGGTVVLVSDEAYTPDCMQKRNEYMVDNSDKVIAIWNGDKHKSGTYNCIKYAMQKNKEIVNLWDIVCVGDDEWQQ